LFIFQDLEIAADFNVAVPIAEFLQKLKESDHINVSPDLKMSRVMTKPT
jgi:hypothetical protein